MSIYPHVSDFCLSRCLFEEDESTEISKTAFVGTPKYMAPELLQCQKDYNSSVDVYAFGVMAYEIVTGQEPYTKNGEHLTFQTILNKVVYNNEMPEYPDDVSIQMRCLINSCLNKNSCDRPPFDFIYSQLSSQELNFLDVHESDKQEILNYIDLLQQGRKVANGSNGLQKVIEMSVSENGKNEPSNSSTSGSKHGFIFNQKCELINKKLNKERKSYSKVVKRLIPKVEDINEKDEDGNTILHLVYNTGNISLVKTCQISFII